MPLGQRILLPREEVPQENLPSTRVAPPYNRPTGSNRRPLQPLTISSHGNILDCRESVLRPFPSPDKENRDAIVQAISHRVAHRTREIKRLSLLHLPAHSFQRQRRLQRRRLRRNSLRQSVTANMISATRRNANNRLSLQFDSDGSGSGSGTESEPDLSHLGMTRRGMTAVLEQQADQMTYDEDAMSQGQYDAEEASLDENLDENVDDNDDDNVDEQVEGEQEPLAMMDPVVFGLKEISNLGKFTVSSHKPGNGVEQLRSDDLTSYWQSDGPQPHKLTIYFVKRVGIRDIRFYVNYNEDESYTPTKIIFKSGTSENNLIQFAAMNLASPVGWQQVPLAGVGGEPDGNTLVSWVLQMQILENHQNGKDTHLRGIKIYAFDADAVQPSEAENSRMDETLDTMDIAESRTDASNPRLDEIAQTLAAARLEGGDSGFTLPDFMRDAEIR
ncbi:anaphase-promoting complex subunit 10 [Trichoderma harzianum]|uniref:Anaphase-promoting complex subunit 10 n=1 Tax=Trichoderma harzianum TaxID=5544 RepID=A0A0F9WY62_TRIHA|nr:anaphase-promoting complex subunit 10 [Trichoderma harzianum]